jgi:hypothetical protein
LRFVDPPSVVLASIFLEGRKVDTLQTPRNPCWVGSIVWARCALKGRRWKG